MDFLKDLLLKDIADHIPYMVGVVGGKSPKLNVTRLSEVFIPFGIIFYFLFGIMEAQEKIEDRIAKIERAQSVSLSQVKDLREDVGSITKQLQKVGFSKFTE